MTPLVSLALWFPLIVFTGARELVAIVLFLIELPLFAVTSALGTRRWPAARILDVLAFTYALLAGIAFVIVRSR